jgi:uncharacterized protein YaeQ
MALSATIYHLTIDLADIDRHVYEALELRVARQPSETAAFMLMRVLAYCLEYRDGIEFTEGVASGTEPAVLVRDLTGQLTAWIEVGMPDASRVHRGSKLAGRAAIYTHRDVRQVLAQLQGSKIHNSDAIPIYAFARAFIDDVAAAIERRSSLTLQITDRELYVTIGDRTFTTRIEQHRLS